MWKLSNDESRPVITAEEHIKSAHRGSRIHLPGTAIVFFIGSGTEHLSSCRASTELPEPLPSFLNKRPVWTIDGEDICFLYGGAGAPMAADTVETLAALGVRNILTVGMFGAFSPIIKPGEIIVPEKAFIEEGTSLHYYKDIVFSEPDCTIQRRLTEVFGKHAYPIVSTDAVYRQTFMKEQEWRENGAVGVDMETSAVFSVSKYLGIRTAALLMASDVHPLTPDAPEWEWKMTAEMRRALAEMSADAARAMCEDARELNDITIKNPND